jgi:hypothetical protein
VSFDGGRSGLKHVRKALAMRALQYWMMAVADLAQGNHDWRIR